MARKLKRLTVKQKASRIKRLQRKIRFKKREGIGGIIASGPTGALIGGTTFGPVGAMVGFATGEAAVGLPMEAKKLLKVGELEVKIRKLRARRLKR